MKPEKWVELQLSKASAFLAPVLGPLVELLSDPRAHVAIVLLALTLVLWRMVSLARAKGVALEADRYERAAREEARARDKLEKASKKRRQHGSGERGKHAVVVADVAPPHAPPPSSGNNNKSNNNNNNDASVSNKKSNQGEGATAGRQPYMARLHRAAKAATNDVDGDGWDYEREYEEEQTWRREVASADSNVHWTPEQTSALKTALRTTADTAGPNDAATPSSSREARFRAVAAHVPGKDWMQCAAKLLAGPCASPLFSLTRALLVWFCVC